MTSLPVGLGTAYVAGFSLAGVLAVVLAASAIVSVLKSQQFSGGERTMWILVSLIFPIVGPLVYFGVRSDW